MVLFLFGGEDVPKARYADPFEEERSATGRAGRSAALAFLIEAKDSWGFAGGWLLVLILTSQQKEPWGRTHVGCWPSRWVSQQHEERVWPSIRQKYVVPPIATVCDSSTRVTTNPAKRENIRDTLSHAS